MTATRTTDGLGYSSEEVGFTKLDGKWCLAIRTVRGDERADEDKVEIWPFTEAPRGLRVKAVKKFPDLLDRMVIDGHEMIAEVTEQVKELDFLAGALESVMPPVEKKQQIPIRPMTAKPEAKK